MEVDPTPVCELLVGLGDVEVVGVNDDVGVPLRVHVRAGHRDRTAMVAASGCGLTGIGGWSWWTSRRSADRSGWRGTSAGGVARTRSARRGLSPNRTVSGRWDRWRRFCGMEESALYRVR